MIISKITNFRFQPGDRVEVKGSSDPRAGTVLAEDNRRAVRGGTRR
jgi:hypothetical protein